MPKEKDPVNIKITIVSWVFFSPAFILREHTPSIVMLWLFLLYLSSTNTAQSNTAYTMVTVSWVSQQVGRE